MDTLLKTALLGTQKMPLDASVLPEAVQHALARAPKTSPEQQLLNALLFSRVYQTSGELPRPTDALALISTAETRPVADRKTNGILSKIMRTEPINPILLMLCVEKIASKGQIIAPEYLVDLFNSCVSVQKLRPEVWQKVAPILGVRGEWLRPFNADWQVKTGETFEQIWQYGKASERLEAFKKLRQNDVQKSFQYFETSWETFNARERKDYLTALQVNFNAHEVPFVERIWSALLETKGTVKAATQELKQLAIQLLLSIETSILTQSVGDRLRQYLKIERKAMGLIQKNVFTIPAAPDQWLCPEVMVQQFGFDAISPDAHWTDTEYWLLRVAEMLHPAAWEKVLGNDWQSIFSTLSDVHGQKNKRTPLPLVQSIGVSLARQPYRVAVLAYLKKIELTDETAAMLRALTWTELEQYALKDIPLHTHSVARLQLLALAQGAWSPKLSLAVMQAIAEWEHYDPRNAEFAYAACEYLDSSVLPMLEQWAENNNLNDWRIKMTQQQILEPTIRILRLRQVIEKW
jgi:Family of unknown function (DUF5691)